MAASTHASMALVASTTGYLDSPFLTAAVGGGHGPRNSACQRWRDFMDMQRSLRPLALSGCRGLVKLWLLRRLAKTVIVTGVRTQQTVSLGATLQIETSHKIES